MFEPHIRPNRLEDKYLRDMMASPVKKGMILLYGDSDFTRWQPLYGNASVEELIRKKDGSQAIVNHGFGTSTAEELLYYYPRLVRPWEPRALVLKAFGNDTDVGYSPEEIIALLSRVCEYARTDFPGIRIFIFSPKPLVADKTAKGFQIWCMKEFRRLARLYCECHGDAVYVDQWAFAPFFTEGGVGKIECIREDIFLPDKVHFNEAGYAIYREFVTGVLGDLL